MNKKTRRVLLIRIGAMGNALVSVPAIRALRQAWPDAYLGMVADPLTREVLSACPYIDEFIDYDNRGSEKAGPGYARFIFKLWQADPCDPFPALSAQRADGLSFRYA